MFDSDKPLDSDKPTGATSSFEERRATQRLDIEMDVSAIVVGTGKAHLFKTADVSAGGLRFVSEKPVEVGDRLNLYIPLVRHQKPLEVNAKVVWCSRSGEDSYMGGAMFIELPPQTHQEISQFISN